MVIIVILHQQTQKYNIYQLKSNMAAKTVSSSFPDKGDFALLDSYSLSYHWCVLSNHWSAGTCLHDSSDCVQLTPWTMVVWQCLSAWKFL